MNAKHKNNEIVIFESYLTPDEEIIWSDQPLANKLFSTQDLFLIPFSLLWGGFALVWEAMALSSGPSFAILWGIPFVLVGQYMIWGRFIYKYLSRRQTYYAITPQRILILKTLFGQDLSAHYLNQLPTLTLRGQSLLFGEPIKQSRSRGIGIREMNGETQSGFYALPDVDHTYQILQTLLARKSKHDDSYD